MSAAEESASFDPSWVPRILLVDDSADFRDLAGRILQRIDVYELVEADQISSGMALLEAGEENARQGAFDLILLDIDLPDGNGVDACRKIKTDRRFRDVPILMVTAHSDSQLLDAAFAAGAMDYLTKPIEKLVFLARVRSALRLKREIDARRDRERQLLALTERLEEANKALLQLSEVDPLTELANRRKFDMVLDNEWRRCQREKRPLALILADIDRFKHYNDHYGHQLGDVCLQRVAVVLGRAARRPGDLACRWGGEEFALILPGVDEVQGPIVADYLRGQVENLSIEHLGGEPKARLTVSLGVAAIVPTSALTPADLLASADKALYRAKEEGRNRVGCLLVPLKPAVPPVS